MQNDPFLTAADVAAILRISPETVGAWARSGLLPSVKLGRKTRRFDPRAVRALVERRAKTRRKGDAR